MTANKGFHDFPENSLKFFYYNFMMKKIFTLAFLLTFASGPVLAWGWGGDADCPYSKEKASQTKTEQVEESDK